jgi:hypothetical protein
MIGLLLATTATGQAMAKANFVSSTPDANAAVTERHRKLTFSFPKSLA